MNPEDISLVQASFRELRTRAGVVADLFYRRLFVLDPSLRALFKGDMAHQGRMLMSMLQASVSGLDNLGGLMPVVRQLGARHATYGVREEHYATVGEAWLWTLEQTLGDRLTPDVLHAWTTTYELLADIMQFGAKETHGGLTTSL